MGSSSRIKDAVGKCNNLRVVDLGHDGKKNPAINLDLLLHGKHGSLTCIDWDADVPNFKCISGNQWAQSRQLQAMPCYRWLNQVSDVL